MAHLNENAIAYMNKRAFATFSFRWKPSPADVRLHDWKISVRFTDEEKESLLAQGYTWEPSEL